MSRRLRLGVIGAGAWTVAHHLPNLARRRDELEFVAVSRLGGESVRKMRDEWGFAIGSEDFRAVVEAGIDVCIVASPAALHHEHTKAALEAGAHVLVEKPMTISARDAWDLVETAAARRAELLVSYGWNYLALVREAKQLVDQGVIGEVEQAQITMASAVRPLLLDTGGFDYAPEAVPEATTWTQPALSGGGYGQAQLTHALGLGLWLTGLRGAEVFALMAAPPPGASVELHDALAVRYQGDAIGTVQGGASHGSRTHLQVRAIGSEGEIQIQVDLDRPFLRFQRAGQKEQIVSLRPDAGRYDCDAAANTLVDIALGQDVENCSPGELGARVVEILEAAYRSSQSNRIESVHSGRPKSPAR